MSNINLQKDCEAFYTFDERSFDSQRNVIQDRSGYGRHAEANGGPSIGVDGPAGFEAASFDGSDDYFKPQQNVFNNLQTPFSIAVSVKQSDSTDNRFIGAYSGGTASTSGFLIHNEFGDQDLSLLVNTGSTSIQPVISLPVGEWKSAVCTYDGTEARVIGAEQTTSRSDDGDYTPPNGSAEPVFIGQLNAGDNEKLNGEIAYIAAWSRILSDAEIDYLNRLTGPRRAQL